MYNVKILKYPSGWQVRVYTRPVGYKLEKEIKIREGEWADVPIYNNDLQDFEVVRCRPKELWENPFSGDIETTPLKYFDEKDSERSVKVSFNRTKNKVYHLARSNMWDWFITLTFDPQKVNSFDYDECVNALKNWLDTVRRISPDLKYIIVPEQHESGRYHFHGLVSNCEADFVYSGHKDKKGREIYNLGKYRLGWSTATHVDDNEKATKYLSKYITKELCSVAEGRKRYWSSRNLSECECDELLIEGAFIEPYLKRLMRNAKYSKCIEGADLKTYYFEMGVPDDDKNIT